jgi:hypothetical protein
MLFVVLSAASVLRADRLVVNGQIRKGLTVTAIDGRQVNVKGLDAPIADVDQVILEHAALPQAATGILLTDGSRLAGSMLDRNTEQVTFYSVTIGRLILPAAQVAGVFYQPAEDWRDVEVTPPALITRSGEVVQARRILWADHETAAVLTAGGLRKFPVSSVSRVLWSTPGTTATLTLRNGDVINTPLTFRGQHFSFTLGGREHRLPLKAATHIHFSK